jgi:demethylmenaquinone methyltransferase/2-methoxy-6-polyprenyl-1,4-benzoquinol methylase
MPISDHVLAAYADHATDYEWRTALYQGWRELLVDSMPLRPGDVVLDVGCGTGLCFEPVQRKIGTTGKIIGIDEAPAMLAVAARHVIDNGWRNIELLTTPVEDATIAQPADAALFCAVHDIMQSPPALHTVLTAVRPGAWVGAVGGKWPTPWLASALVAAIHAPFVRDFTGFDRPWRYLAELVDDLQITEVALGTGYLVLGRNPPHNPAARRTRSPVNLFGRTARAAPPNP